MLYLDVRWCEKELTSELLQFENGLFEGNQKLVFHALNRTDRFREGFYSLASIIQIDLKVLIRTNQTWQNLGKKGVWKPFKNVHFYSIQHRTHHIPCHSCRFSIQDEFTTISYLMYSLSSQLSHYLNFAVTTLV